MYRDISTAGIADYVIENIVNVEAYARGLLRAVNKAVYCNWNCNDRRAPGSL